MTDRHPECKMQHHHHGRGADTTNTTVMERTYVCIHTPPYIKHPPTAKEECKRTSSVPDPRDAQESAPNGFFSVLHQHTHCACTNTTMMTMMPASSGPLTNSLFGSICAVNLSASATQSFPPFIVRVCAFVTSAGH